MTTENQTTGEPKLKLNYLKSQTYMRCSKVMLHHVQVSSPHAGYLKES